MKNLETYIFVHDQEIILDFINKKRFSEFSDLKYVFLSYRPSDKINNLKNVIICKDLESNIEEYPKLTSFTGWYCLVKNNLIKSKYVNLFEYDINYIDKFTEINEDLVKKEYDFIGYFPMSTLDPVYLLHKQYSEKLLNSIKKKTNVDFIEKLIDLGKNEKNVMWSSSSNSTWKTEKLIDYVDWFSQFIDDIKNDQFCGHMHERSLSFFYFIKNLNVQLTSNLISHYQLNTHGTSPLPKDRFNQLYPILK